MSENYMPVLVGVGQVTEREFDIDSSSALDLIEQAAYAAAADAGLEQQVLADLDELVASKQSTMPEGLLMTFTKEEILDLLAFLQHPR